MSNLSEDYKPMEKGDEKTVSDSEQNLFHQSHQSHQQQHELPFSYRQIFEKLKEQIEISTKYPHLKGRSVLSRLVRMRESELSRQPISFIEEFADSYLRCLNIFSQIKSSPQWHSYLKSYRKLLIQANLLLYPEKNSSLKDIWRYLWVQLPAQLWRYRLFHLTSFIICSVTALLGFIIVLQDFEMASLFLPPFLRSSYELEAYLFSESAQREMLTFGQDLGLEAKSIFASFLLVNNAKVALIAFTSGFLYGIPTLLILIQTGLMLGTLPALFYHGDLVGLGAWMLPHGVPEVTAIILSGGAGLRLGLTMLNPGGENLGRALKKELKSLSGTVIICLLLLVWAAIVESFVRQSDLSYAVRYSIAGFSLFPIFLLFARAFFAYRSLEKE